MPNVIKIGQIRRWTIENLRDFIWRVVALPGGDAPIYRNNDTFPHLGAVLGKYLQRGEHVKATHNTVTEFTEANATFVTRYSEVVQDVRKPSPGKRLSDFQMGFTVTDEDRACGIPDSCQKCPVARALERAIRARFRRWKNYEISVGDNRVQLYVGEDGPGFERKKYEAKCSVAVHDFIHVFDRGKAVPGENPPSVPFDVVLDFKTGDP
jgi:hypothetical protein